MRETDWREGEEMEVEEGGRKGEGSSGNAVKGGGRGGD